MHLFIGCIAGNTPPFTLTQFLSLFHADLEKIHWKVKSVKQCCESELGKVLLFVWHARLLLLATEKIGQGGRGGQSKHRKVQALLWLVLFRLTGVGDLSAN